MRIGETLRRLVVYAAIPVLVTPEHADKHAVDHAHNHPQVDRRAGAPVLNRLVDDRGDDAGGGRRVVGSFGGNDVAEAVPIQKVELTRERDVGAKHCRAEPVELLASGHVAPFDAGELALRNVAAVRAHRLEQIGSVFEIMVERAGACMGGLENRWKREGADASLGNDAERRIDNDLAFSHTNHRLYLTMIIFPRKQAGS